MAHKDDKESTYAQLVLRGSLSAGEGQVHLTAGETRAINYRVAVRFNSALLKSGKNRLAVNFTPAGKLETTRVHRYLFFRPRSSATLLQGTGARRASA